MPSVSPEPSNEREEILQDRLETSMNVLPQLQGRLEHLQVPGLQGRITDVSHPFTNIVTGCRLEASGVDAAMDEVFAIFAARRATFGWIVGPSTRPMDVPDRLTARGMKKVASMAGLVFDDFGVDVAASEDIEVSELHGEEVVQVRTLAGRIDPSSGPVSALLFDAIAQPQTGVRSRFYVGRNEGKRVAWATMSYLPGEPIVLLGGASTLPAYRGRGAYRSLLSRRITDARRDGITAALIQANEATSGPICRRLGFRDLGRLDVYACRAERAT